MSIVRSLGFAAALLGATAAPGLAQTGTIAGTITTASTTTSSLTVYDSTGRIVSTVNGPSSSAPNLSPGNYFVVASAAGHVTELYDNIPCVAADCVPTSGTAIAVTSGATATANFTLTTGGRILGTVRRASDVTTIGSVNVFLYNAATSLVTSTVTAADGTYVFATLPAGTYFLRVGAPAAGQPAPDYVQELYGGTLCPVIGTGFGCRIASGTPVTVVDGADTTAIDFSLDHGARVNGQATLGGVGVPNVTVTVYAAGQPIGVPATTDASGFYTVVGLPPGQYYARANPATSATANLVELWYNGVTVASGGRPTTITLTAGQAATGINFAFFAGGTINGTVTFTDPGTGASAQQPPTIEVYNSVGILVKSKALTGVSPITYQIDGLPSGNYFVKAASMAPTSPTGQPPSGLFVDEVFNNINCVAEDCLPTGGSPVFVTPGQNANNVNFDLATGGRIVGTVHAGTMVEIYDSRGVRLPRRTFTAGTASATAAFEATGLPSGTYYLLAVKNRGTNFLFTLENESIAPELYHGFGCSGCAVTFGTPVTVTAGGTVGGIFFTGVTGGSIAGTVTDSGLAGLSTITVEVYAASGTFVTSTTTAFDGKYRINGLAPGNYFLRTVNNRGYADEVFDNMACAACSVTLGTPIAVTASTTATANISLNAGTLLGGVVRADLGGPLPGTVVSVFTSTGTLVAKGTADALGNYSVALPAGSYRARTDAKPSYVQEMYNNLVCALGTCDVTTGTAITLAATPLTNIDFGLAACFPRTLSPGRLANAAVGSAYRQVLTATGSTVTSTRRFSIVAGVLPPGLALDATTGIISGTPTANGSFTFTVGVTDSSGCVGTKDYTLDVPACAFTLATTSASLRASGEQYMINLTSSCGTVTATSNAPWITIDSAGSAAVAITAAANIAAASRTGTVAIGPRVFTVFQSGTTVAPPFGTVDTPIEGSNANGSIAVTGWALDDIGVNRVTIYRDPVSTETPGVPIFIGQAIFVTGARPDVEAIYSTLPLANRAGWGYLLLTNMLPPQAPGGAQGTGTYRLLIYAEDGDLNTTLLGTRTINGNNATATAPFGAIDTPGQGVTVSGTAYSNFGWALTPQPKMIPVSGSTISVILDGVSLGPVSQYNLFRSDVSNLFPNLKNSGGPVGFRALDTTTLTEGVHTLAWIAFDDGGQGTGIGSRYINVQNSAWQPSLTTAATTPALDLSVVPPRVAGPDTGRRAANLSLLPIAEAQVSLRTDHRGIDEPEPVDPDEAGLRTVRVHELERIELSLASADTCSSSYAGYLVGVGEARELPAGSTLDAAGTFYWQTAPGFIGTYRLVFVRTACDGTRERIPVSVTILPR